MKYLILIIILIILLLWNYSKFGNVTEKIDIVYTWVNGKDPLWRNAKRQSTGINSTGDPRVENVDELKYSIKSVMKYASWVNNIYIVVDDIQRPSFIDYSNPKIHIIKHSDIIAKRYLPMYNSNAIEANIHHIKGLSEKFLYLNDDMFFGNNVSQSELTNSVYGQYREINNPVSTDISHVRALKINYGMILSLLPSAKYFHPWHQAILCKRSLMYQLEKMFPEQFEYTNSNRIRYNDNNLPNNQDDFWLIGLQQMYGLILKKYTFNPNQPSNEYIEMRNNQDSDKLNKLYTSRPKLICINNIENNLPFLDNYFK